jgi:hypothetical protein
MILLSLFTSLRTENKIYMYRNIANVIELFEGYSDCPFDVKCFNRDGRSLIHNGPYLHKAMAKP